MLLLADNWANNQIYTHPLKLTLGNIQKGYNKILRVMLRF